MNLIPLAAVPSQSLSITLDRQRYDLRIHDCGNDVMSIDVTINNEIVLTGIRMVPNYPIIVSKYMQNGNFILQTMNNQYPDWTRFGIDQNLIYANQAEIGAIDGSTT
jgi:hypothetical protein